VFRAALSKLRTEFNVRTRNTGLEARNGVSAVRRGLEHVERKMAGDMQVLKHDVELDMNGSKDENRNGAKMLDLQIEVSCDFPSAVNSHGRKSTAAQLSQLGICVPRSRAPSGTLHAVLSVSSPHDSHC